MEETEVQNNYELQQDFIMQLPCFALGSLKVEVFISEYCLLCPVFPYSTIFSNFSFYMKLKKEGEVGFTTSFDGKCPLLVFSIKKETLGVFLHSKQTRVALENVGSNQTLTGL